MIHYLEQRQTIEYVRRFVIPAAYFILPPQMESQNATAMLLAIGLQESKFLHRRQIKGPARGFYQFEEGGGVKGVLTHSASRDHARNALVQLAYPRAMTVAQVYDALQDNDVLATVFARLLLWTLPEAIPGSRYADIGWSQYLAAWRPGKPHPETWPQHFAVAHGEVLEA